MKNRPIYAAIGLLSLLLGAVIAQRQLRPELPPAPAVARLLSLSLPDESGKAQELVRWKGKTLLVNFWAPWCPPCVEEMPALSALQSELAEKNTQLLGIGIDSLANIAQFSSKLKISYPLYAAGMEGTDLSRQFGNKAGGLPFTVLIGPEGQIKKTYLGRVKLNELRKDLALP